MAKLEDLTRGAAVKGVLPDCLVTVIDVKWYGSAAVELGEERLELSLGDLFVVPSWTELRVTSTPGVELFSFSDAPVYEAIGLDRRRTVGP